MKHLRKSLSIAMTGVVVMGLFSFTGCSFFMLSFKLFKHLFALPLKYFESRRVGETVARVRELDSIRNFLTGTPLSSMIDLIFIIVYIVVLFFYSKIRPAYADRKICFYYLVSKWIKAISIAIIIVSVAAVIPVTVTSAIVFTACVIL